MKLYAGNMSFETTEEDLKKVFEPFGTVESVTIIKDRGTGRSKGFGFVEMSSSSEGQAAIEGLNGVELNARKLSVNEARPLTPRNRNSWEGGSNSGSGNNRRGRGSRRDGRR